MTLLLPLLLTPGRSARAQDQPSPPKIATAKGVEVGKHPFLSVVTLMCGPLESDKDYAFDPQMYGKVRSWSPLSSRPPLLVYTCTLNTGFFRLARALDALIAKDPKRWQNANIVVMDEKGAQRGGYTADEVVKRREEIRRLARLNHITHFSFFLSAQGAGSITPSLELTPATSLDVLLATLTVNDDNPRDKRPIVQSVLRLESGKLNTVTSRKFASSFLAGPVQSQ